ncbi:glycosyltransferase [Latilactobacillus sakei]|uniref:glycosyltransferase n=1 Tax=Latilactobacillus sakei TaxID=1599 RepID=UPI00345C7840
MEAKVDMRNKAVSVVLASYNGEKYIEKQLMSIINQTILPGEIIVIDDASTDNTVKIINDFKSKHAQNIDINIIVRSHNVGYVTNFIQGIDKARGELVFLCDQDDLWRDNKVEFLLNLFKNNNKIMAIHSNTSIIDKNDNIIKSNTQNYRNAFEKITLKQYIKKVNYPGMAMAFRKESIFKKIREAIEGGVVPSTHDWLIGCIASMLDGFYVTKEILTYRRYTGNNVALNIETSRLSDIDVRIKGVKLYKDYYLLLEKLQKIYNINIIKAEKYVENADNRISYLQNKSLFKVIWNITNITYYPSFKAYMGDLILNLKVIKRG